MFLNTIIIEEQKSVIKIENTESSLIQNAKFMQACL